MSDRPEAESLSFEDAYRALQDVVDRLEKGNLPLDESVALFAYGTELVRRCTALLDQAELKVRLLSQETMPEATLGEFPDEETDTNADGAFPGDSR